MRRIILSMLLLLTATTYAQVGINKEDPKATLDINAKEESSPSNKVEGLLIPRVSKEKALLMAGNGELQESTMIYVNSMTITSSPNETVEDITENGYYFWNKTKWVKQTGQNGEEWIYDPTTKQINLKRSGQGEFKNHVFYDENGGYKNIDFGIQLEGSSTPGETPLQFWDRIKNSEGNLTFNYFGPYNALIKNASSIPTPTNIATGKEGTSFSKFLKYNLLNIDKTTTDEDRNFTINGGGVVVRKEAVLTTPLNSIIGNSSYADYMNATKIANITSFSGTSYVREGASATNLKGGYFASTSSGTVDNLYAAHTYVELGNTSTSSSNVAGYATNMSLDGQSEHVQGMISWLSLKPTANINEVFGNRVNFASESGATINTLFGYKLETHALKAGTNITNYYGIYLEDVKGASNDNYSIYTKAGKLRFGDLADSSVSEKRLVVADTDGVLSTSTTSLSDLESLWANDASNTRVYLKKTSTGSNRVDTQGDPTRNSVTISDAGSITAKGFIGYNGASIFPDYVFEKYYKGYSDIKADYDFHNLTSVETFIKKNGHLPGYQSAKEIAKEGLIDIGATQLTNIEKIEELYLHTIEQEKKIKAQKAELEVKTTKIEELEARLERLEKLINK